MKHQFPFVIGSIICLGLAGYYGYLIVTSNKKLTTGQPAAAQPTLNRAILQQLRDKTKNGALPIEIKPDELGNTQPF